MMTTKTSRAWSVVTLGMVFVPSLIGCNTRTGAQPDTPAVQVAAQQDTNNTTINAPRTTAPVVQTPAIRDAAAMQNAFVQVAKVSQPAVVTITTERRLPRAVRGYPGPGPFGDPFDGSDPFEEFFRRFRGFGFEPSTTRRGERVPGLHQIQEERGGGLGSGLIYDADGLILTNAHVVQGADEVAVRLADGREFRNARVLGADERTDVAVVKINAAKLPTLPLGDSSDVRVGDWAIAMGNPFGLEQTLTVGVISAKAREVPLTVSGPGDYLQTDASINPGNSGGPLLDIYGRVIGVNNAIYSRTGGNVGIGFAIPINTAREIAQILVKEGRVRRAQLGIAISNVEDQAAFGLDPKTRGVLVESVEPNSPASRAGLQPGDVVQAVNGQPVTRGIELQRLISRAPVGSTARLKILRAGKTLTVPARLEELKETESAAAPDSRPAPDGAPTALGLQIAALTPELARRYGIPATTGVIVVGVPEGSPGQAAGLRPGDVIERVGQTAVATPREVQAAVKSILARQSGEDKSVALYINRRGERQFVIVEVGK